MREKRVERERERERERQKERERERERNSLNIFYLFLDNGQSHDPEKPTMFEMRYSTL